jgi:hypothetical protein
MSASPEDKTYTNQLKAAAILEPIARRQPNHPGVAHYLIHTYDYPALAAKGLDAAVRYAKIAEAAPHAQHMPSHIFTRVGRWNDSIASNGAAARLAKADNEPDDRLHAMDYLVYAYLQLARDREARQIVDEMSTVTGFNLDRNTGPFALAAKERGMAREALATYEEAMVKEPNRFHSLAGAANAAERLGDTAKAKAYYAKRVAMTDGVNADRRELVAARQFLERK